MDLRNYYQKIREAAEKIAEDVVLVVSHEGAAGGKAGVFTEVARQLAAKLLVEGAARLATLEESAAYKKAQAEARRVAEQLLEASKMQISVLSTAELNRLRGAKTKE